MLTQKYTAQFIDAGNALMRAIVLALLKLWTTPECAASDLPLGRIPFAETIEELMNNNEASKQRIAK